MVGEKKKGTKLKHYIVPTSGAWAGFIRMVTISYSKHRKPISGNFHSFGRQWRHVLVSIFFSFKLPFLVDWWVITDREPVWSSIEGETFRYI